MLWVIVMAIFIVLSYLETNRKSVRPHTPRREREIEAYRKARAAKLARKNEAGRPGRER